MVNQQCSCPRGKGVGGTTLINGLMFVRGNRIDFDNWAREGNPGWSYEEVLPYFLKLENFNKTDPGAVVDEEYHGHGGNLNVEYPVPRHPLVSLWLDANEEKGYKVVDYNGRQQMGAAVGQMNTNHGRREDGGNAYIKSIRNRRNLKILTNSLVTKVAIGRRSKTAYGVQFAHNGSFYLAKAKKEVILSAGAIGSAQILMLSGVGPSRHLQEVGIEVVEDLEVGSKLQDHATFPKLYFNSDFPKTHKRLNRYIEEYLNGTGALAVPNHYAGLGFYQTKFATEPDYPDLEIMMIPSDGFSEILEKQLADAKGETPDPKKSFYMFIAGLHLRSSGTVRLKSNNPFDYPLIDARFLSDPDNVDVDTLYEGVQLALSLVDTKPFKEINTSVVRHDLPACNSKTFLSESYWHCVIRQFTGIVGHPVGTCRMGPEEKSGAVVNAKAEVHGIKKLRVVDASIFPFTFSGHPNAPCVMAGEKVSDLIKQDYLS
jgi:choline dehydrogenase-like flavoprotein